MLLARQFQYSVELFFRTIIINGPLGKTLYYAIRVEFQLRGSPHIHSFVWILNAPILCKDNISEYKSFIDETVNPIRIGGGLNQPRGISTINN